VIVCRSNSHDRIRELARFSQCPVINGLTEVAHPCQALADLFTVREFHGQLQGLKVAFVGDANNVARSLAAACGKLGVAFAIASPRSYQFDDSFLVHLRQEVGELDLTITELPNEAVRSAVAVYTDVWTSMGQEAEHERRMRDFRDYQVNESLMKQAAADAIFLHCLPARRGEEVSDEVMDGPQSAVIQQAANRMHVQKGILAWLLGATG
jgi:ornithine carbamoyltransferase